MCGIAGIFNSRGNELFQNQVLQAMADKMILRGPDDSGIWYEHSSGIGLAHRRLAIIDLSKEGSQPMHSFSGRYTIVLNGEIYNYRELRNELAFENIKWRGNSDTEVLVNAIDSWGVEKAIARLNGMFAFALWDHQAKRLTLVRDQMGKKPLYYGFNNSIFFFASELKALKAHPEFRPEIDRNVVALLLRHSYISAPYSIYKGIVKLLPGSFLQIGKKDIEQYHLPKAKKYWDINQVAIQGIENPFAGSPKELDARIDELLTQSVSRRMIADVPLGAFLSGGIDSSMVVALMQKISPTPVKTFTIGFESKAYNEAGAAKEVANYLGTDHTQLLVTPKQALDVIPDLPFLYDEPFADSSQIPTYLVSKLTRKYVTVALSGDGGDEIFAGYNRHFWGRHLFAKLEQMPLFLRKGLKSIINAWSAKKWNSFFAMIKPVLPAKFKQTMPGDKLAKLSDVLALKSKQDFYYSLTSWSKDPEALMVDSLEPKTLLNDFQAWPDLKDFTHLMQAMDMATYLPDDILTKVDRASMGASLEARAPFLDREVVAFSWQIPVGSKITADQGKIILRQLLYQYVPQPLVDQPKSGFGIPLDTWLRGELKEWAADLLTPSKLKSDGYFIPEKVHDKWSDHLSGRKNYQYHLWNILMFQSWLEQEKRYG